ncbi:endoribonuclease Dicer-like [Paramacrobiotus metropolitanus]|uniref:endoribonuclease Dicer-like n=1 Tax=Paramacrobiotus metropolitanus TaxID=2943436 RepID=UPI00244648D1|nr:endoribonuclease Dicer-like [Paramacrobiotus metropolitanus]
MAADFSTSMEVDENLGDQDNIDLADIALADDIQNRPYQDELIDLALKENVICALGTGMGKTQIAVGVCKRLLFEITVPWDEGGKRTIMVVPTVPLVDQQAKYFRRWLPISVKGYHGGICVKWNKESWEAEFRAHQMLLMVPDVLKDLLHNWILDVSRINLLILDECHRAGKSHSYREIMRYIEKRPSSERPRILGLTASVVQCKLRNLDGLNALIAEREECLGAKVCTSVDETVGLYEAKPQISVEVFQPQSDNDDDTEICSELDETIQWLDSAKTYLREILINAASEAGNVDVHGMSDEHFQLGVHRSLQLLRSSLSQMRETYRSLGPWCAYQVACMVKKDFELLIRNKCFYKELVNPALSAISELHIFGSLLEIKKHTKNIPRGDIEAISEVASPKLRKLMDVMMANKPSEKVEDASRGLRCIVFVQSRFDAWALAKFFSFLSVGGSGEFSFIKSGYLVGQLLPSGSDGEKPYRVGLNHAQSAATLEKFRRGAVNVLIATNVVEEGLDVPDCNLIIRLDKPSNYCSYVQSKGRARAQNSRYIVFSDSFDKTKRELDEYDKLDQRLKDMCVERVVPDMDTQSQHFSDKSDHFSPPGSKAMATLNTALTLLQKYCNSLEPRLRFSAGNVHGKYIHSSSGLYAFRIYMRLDSALKHPVTGPFKKSRKLAKQAAALQCVEELYNKGVLDENLLPIVETHQDDMFLMIGDRQKEPTTEGEGAAGSKRRKQFYPKKTASLLNRCRPIVGMPCHLYLIRIEHQRSFLKDDSSRFLADDSRCIGFLSRCAMPPFPAFNVYMCRAEYQITLSLLSDSIILNSQKLDDIQKAHCAIYEQALLFIEAIALHFDENLDSEAFYVVPLTKLLTGAGLYGIDWEMIDRIKDPAQYSVISLPEEERRYRKVKPTSFVDGVVVRWYKPEDDRFFITNMRDDMTPATPCKLDEYTSFSEYFERKYGIQIQDLNQPIMDAIFCSKRLNLIKFVYHGIKPDETAKDSRAETKRNGQLMLVPELCQLFPMPAPLYIKCLVLPSLQHRMRWFSHMLSLYRRLKSETGIGIDTVEPDSWPPLVYQGKTQRDIEGASQRYLQQDTDQEMSVAVVSGNKMPEKESSSEPERIETEADELPDDFGLVYTQFVRHKFYSLADEGVDDYEVMKVEEPSPKSPASSDTSANDFYYDLPASGCSPALFECPFSIDAEFSLDVRKLPLPDLNHLLNAVTSAKVADGFNLERLEVIGDTFLKFSSYVYVYFRFRQHQEGRLTQLCDQFVSNFNLYRLAKTKDLQNYVLNQEFNPGDNFVPPGYIFDEQESNEMLANSGTKADKFPSARVHQPIEDKTIADVMEALIGTFLINSSARSAQVFMSWLGLCVLPETTNAPQEGPSVDRYGVFRAEDITSPLLRMGADVDAELCKLTAGFDDFERRIGYRFRNKAFLLQAFTHSTYEPNSITDCYQRLEFLGDAIIDFLITRYVYEDFKSHAPGVMSDLRSALVNNLTFSTLAVKYNYHNHIKFQSLHLHNTIDLFVQTVQEKHQDVLPLQEEMLIADFDDDKDDDDVDIGYEEPEAPKALGDVFEAVAGAIFLDSGLSLDTVWKVYYNIMRAQIEHFTKNCPINPVRELMEREGVNCRFGSAERLSNGKTLVQVTVLGKGTFVGKGNNSRAAKCNASKAALAQIKR